MPHTDLQIKMDYYKKVIADGKKSPHYAKYNEMCLKLEELVKFTDNFNNSEKNISAVDFAKIVKKYSAVYTACKTYLDAEDLSAYEKDRENIVKDIFGVLTKDIRTLKKCDPKQPGSYNDIIDRARKHTVIIDSKKIKRIGAVLSSRIPIKIEGGKKGFFTPVVNYDPDAKRNESIDKMLKAIGDKYPTCKKYLEKLKVNEKLQENFWKKYRADTITKIFEKGREKDAEELITKMAMTIRLVKNKEWAQGFFEDKPELKKAFIEFGDAMISLHNHMSVMTDAGIRKGGNISGRNCAMTDMAKLLDCENVLANSSHMTIRVDDEYITGVFMEAVDGTDITRLKAGEISLIGSSRLSHRGEALAQVADLQVLDFICGNVDRHMGNMIYDVGTSVTQNPVLKGLKGIDNDCAFGTPDVSNNKKVMRMANVDSMQYIRASMAAKLDAIKNRSVLKYRLSGNGLREAEIDAAWERLQMVKKAAELKIIKTVPDNFFDKVPIEKIKPKEDNYFARIQNLSTTAYMAAARNIKVREISYASDIASKQAILDRVSRIEQLREKLNDAKAMVFDSREYAAMESRFKALEKYNAEVKKCKSASEISDKLAKDVTKAYKELFADTNTYVNLKSLLPKTGRGKKRIEVALDLLNFAGETLKDFTPGLDVSDETKRDEELSEEQLNQVEENNIQLFVEKQADLDESEDEIGEKTL